MIKQITAICLAALPLVSWAQEIQFEVNGTVKNSKLDKVYLTYWKGSESQVDSTQVKDGKFRFSGNIKSATKASLSNFNQRPTPEQIQANYPQFTNFYLGKGTTKVKVDERLETAQIDGTAIIKDYKRYQAFLAPAQKGLDQLEESMRNTPQEDYQKKHKETKTERDSLNKAKRELQIMYVNKYPDSHFSPEAIYDQTIFSFDLPLVENLFAKLPESSKNSGTGREIAQKIKNAKEIAPGQMAPPFEEPDANGKIVKLSDFRGKYVLVDFWASWCVPCRAENPNVKAAYEKFKDKGFTVLNVSLDKDRTRWLRAVEEDKLPWTQISALNGFDTEAAKLYHVSAVPATFLIDPTGRIVASNLRGEALHKKLAELLP